MSAINPDGFMESPDGEIEAAAVAAGVPSICPAIDDGADAEGEQDAFAGNAEDVAADETRRKIELFAWADSVLGLNEADLELALEDAVKHFKMTRASTTLADYSRCCLVPSHVRQCGHRRGFG